MIARRFWLRILGRHFATVSMGDPEPPCLCSSLAEVAVVPMGCDGLDERVFATLENVCKHGGDQWWLAAYRCNACAQSWMVAQEERIFDDYFMRRLDEAEVRAIAAGRWPDDFLTYERVLIVGNRLSTPCRFLDPLSPSLIFTAHDLVDARADITLDEIAFLLGIAPDHAELLLETEAPDFN